MKKNIILMQEELEEVKKNITLMMQEATRIKERIVVEIVASRMQAKLHPFRRGVSD